MRYILLVIFIPPCLLGLAGVRFTWGKLDQMRQIRGWKPGAIVETHVVHDKWINEQTNSYWLSLTAENVRRRGNHRLSLPANVWARYQRGDPIEIVYLPNDPSPCHRESVYADDGNFVFDRVLLAIEFGMVLFSLICAGITAWLLRWMSRRRTKGADFGLRRRSM